MYVNTYDSNILRNGDATKQAKNSVPLLLLLGSFSINNYQWELKFHPFLPQSMFKKILGDLDIDGYMGDAGVWSKGLFDDNKIIVDKVLERLEEMV